MDPDLETIARDLLRRGFRPTSLRGFMQRGSQEPLSPVDEDVWDAMREILAQDRNA
jgi:hypothetical protein